MNTWRFVVYISEDLVIVLTDIQGFQRLQRTNWNVLGCGRICWDVLGCTRKL